MKKIKKKENFYEYDILLLKMKCLNKYFYIQAKKYKHDLNSFRFALEHV